MTRDDAVTSQAASGHESHTMSAKTAKTAKTAKQWLGNVLRELRGPREWFRQSFSGCHRVHRFIVSFVLKAVGS
jgi:hypothetical protein